MVAGLLYLSGIIILVADTQAWGISTLALLMIYIASLAGPKE